LWKKRVLAAQGVLVVERDRCREAALGEAELALELRDRLRRVHLAAREHRPLEALVVEHEPDAPVLLQQCDLARTALIDVLGHEALPVLVHEDPAHQLLRRIERQRHRSHAHADRRAARAHAHPDSTAVVALGSGAEARLAQRGRVLADHVAVVHESARAQHDAAQRAVVARLAGLGGVHAHDTTLVVDDQALA
jgi:hypothetical protein